jgi:heavy metal sensor kinase
MTLTTRLSVFFLGALAFVLVGFSVSLYLLAHLYLHRQVDERLESALNTLTAAAEIRPDGVEWEPHERQLSLGREETANALAWMVRDDQGYPLPHSPVLVADDFLHRCSPDLVSGAPGQQVVSYEGRRWLVAQRRVDTSAAAARPEAFWPEPPDQNGNEQKYPALVFSAAVSLEPVSAQLRTLAAVLSGLSLGVWLVAVVLGRRLCRRALLPLTSMAEAARGMSAANLDQRLPAPRTQDELADLGQAFNELLARLQESFERQRRFTGDASHQLRTPLAAMLGQVEVALRRVRSTPEYRDILDRVHEQAVGLRRIVEMLLFLARADAESRAPQLEPVNLSAWLDQCRSRWSTHPRAKDLRMECSAGEMLFVQAQPALLDQLVDNLLENACKYSPDDSPITLRLKRQGDSVLVSVEDAGWGIAPDDLLHVFEPFYRSAAARKRGIGGVGLGLAVARRIAVALGGSLDVESTVNEGSRFTLRLPAVGDAQICLQDSAPLVRVREGA